MSRVRVFGEFTGTNRTVTVGGRSRNDDMKSWINFDCFKFIERPSKRRGAKEGETVIEKGEVFTRAVETRVTAHKDGSISIAVELPDISDIPEGVVTISIHGAEQSIFLRSGKKEE
jgi:hypothetical protein